MWIDSIQDDNWNADDIRSADQYYLCRYTLIVNVSKLKEGE